LVARRITLALPDANSPSSSAAEYEHHGYDRDRCAGSGIVGCHVPGCGDGRGRWIHDLKPLRRDEVCGILLHGR